MLHADLTAPVPSFPVPSVDRQVDERHVYLCAAAPLKEDLDFIQNALLTASFKVSACDRGVPGGNVASSLRRRSTPVCSIGRRAPLRLRSGQLAGHASASPSYTSSSGERW